MKAEIITIEEWAGDNKIYLTDRQIEKLAEAINICKEVQIKSFTNTELNQNIKKLEKKIELLEKFINAKGFTITVNENSITEHYFEKITDSHIASNNRIFRY